MPINAMGTSLDMNTSASKACDGCIRGKAVILGAVLKPPVVFSQPAKDFFVNTGERRVA